MVVMGVLVIWSGFALVTVSLVVCNWSNGGAPDDAIIKSSYRWSWQLAVLVP